MFWMPRLGYELGLEPAVEASISEGDKYFDLGRVMRTSPRNVFSATTALLCRM
jgi:hypothetical protein